MEWKIDENSVASDLPVSKPEARWAIRPITVRSPVHTTNPFADPVKMNYSSVGVGTCDRNIFKPFWVWSYIYTEKNRSFFHQKVDENSD